MDANNFFKAVSDETRLKILSLLMGGDKCVEEIAVQLNIGISTASFHLKKLTAVGLVTPKKVQYYQIYHINNDLLRFSLLDFLNSDENVSSVCACDKNRYQKEAEAYFDGDTLKRLPTKIKVRDAVLQKVAFRLKKRSYTKKQLYIELADIFDDFIFLSEKLIECGYIKQSGEKFAVTTAATKIHMDKK